MLLHFACEGLRRGSCLYERCCPVAKHCFVFTSTTQSADTEQHSNTNNGKNKKKQKKTKTWGSTRNRTSIAPSLTEQLPIGTYSQISPRTQNRTGTAWFTARNATVTPCEGLPAEGVSKTLPKQDNTRPKHHHYCGLLWTVVTHVPFCCSC